MPWEELIRMHDKEPGTLPVVSEDRRNTGSLIQQVALSIGQAAPEVKETLPGEPVRCADGYLRRSPVQFLQTAADYKKRRRRKLISLILAVVIIALAALALFRAGLLR